MTGLRVASLFCGVGGSSLGYKMAGFEVAYANDRDDTAREWYQLNFGLEPDGSDVEDVRGSTILAAADGDLDVLDGSPPCQPFSSAGKRKGTKDERNMFPAFVDLVGEVRPRAFVAENVTGLLHRQNRLYLRSVERDLRAHGYEVETCEVWAEFLGVPQTRHRVIVVGTRNGIGFDPSDVFPVHRPALTPIREKLPDVVRIFRAYRPFETEANEPYRQPKSFHATAPCPTVTTMGIGYIDPAYLLVETVDGEVRPITVDDLKVLNSFPVDFKLPDEPPKAWKLLGNCVPPLMAFSWADRLSALLKA